MNQRRVAYVGILALFLFMGTGCNSGSSDKPGVTASGSVSPDDDDSSDDVDACKDTDESPSACSSTDTSDDTCECAGDDGDMDARPSGSPSGMASDAPECLDGGTPGNDPCSTDSPDMDSSGAPVPCPASSGSPAAIAPDPKALTEAVGDLSKAEAAKDLPALKSSLDAAVPLLETAGQNASGPHADQLKSALAHAKQAQTEKSLAQARTDLKAALEAAKGANVPPPPTN